MKNRAIIHIFVYPLINSIIMTRKLKLNLPILLLAGIALVSCLKETNETIALPEIGTATNVIPKEILNKFENKMDLYEGTNPPDISGCYLMAPSKLYYATDADKAPSNVNDMQFLFYNKKGNTYEFKSRQGSSESYSSLVTVIGSGNDFTAFFTEKENKSDGVSWAIMSTLISGTKTASGISNIKYAFIMLEANDPYNKIMEENEFRIFYDGTGLASNSTWDYTKSTADSIYLYDSTITSAIR